MYRKEDQQSIDDFILPFGGALSPDNRWVMKAEMIPWDDIEGDYSDLYPGDSGNVAKPARLAYGALIIKETLGLTDEETVEQIRENPYLQFFVGFKQYTNKKPFDPSLMVRFRQRFKAEQLEAINNIICEKEKKMTMSRLQPAELRTGTTGKSPGKTRANWSWMPPVFLLMSATPMI